MAPYRYAIERSGPYKPEWSDGDRETPEERDAQLKECFLSLRAKGKAILSARVWTWDKDKREKKDLFFVDVDRLPGAIRLIEPRR